MPEQRCITLYRFNELGPEARKRAIETFRGRGLIDWDAEFVRDDFWEVCRRLGIELDTKTVGLMGGGTRQDPVLYYTVACSQGDGASFAGRYRSAWGSITDPVTEIEHYAPQDAELISIAADLKAINDSHCSVSARINTTGRYHTLTIDWTEVEDSEGETSEMPIEQEEQLKVALVRLQNWFYSRLRAEYEYLDSDEYAIQEIEQSDRLFEVDGAFYE